MRNRKNNSSIKKTPPPPYNIQKKQKKPSIISTLGESMMWGTGMGLGSEAGHSIFRGIFGGNNQAQQPIVNNTCEDIKKLYEKCLISNSFDNSRCEFLKNDIEKFCTL